MGRSDLSGLPYLAAGVKFCWFWPRKRFNLYERSVCMSDDKLILNELNKMIRKYAEEHLVDMDDKFVHKFDLQINRFEDLLRNTNRATPPNRWSYYRMGFIKKGSGEFTTGMYKFKARKNTLVFIPARVITSSRNWSLDMEGYFAFFNMDFFLQNHLPYKYIENRKILNFSIQPYVYLDDNQAEEIEAIFETILKEKQVDNAYQQERIAVKILELLILSERLFDESQRFVKNLPSTGLIQKFTDLVEANFLQERTVKFYADQLAVHPNYLNSIIKKNMGITAKESIQNRLLIETKYLLHSTNLSIKEISSQVGFTDPNYFTSFFTKSENLSPGSYRSLFV
jgi:AraC family transcriptional activator of pobA